MVHKTYVEIMVPELVGGFLRIIHQVRKRDIRLKKIKLGGRTGTCSRTRELIRKLVHHNKICLNSGITITQFSAKVSKQSASAIA